MKKKSFLSLLIFCLMLPFLFFISACGQKPPEGPKNSELLEFKTIATNIIQSYREDSFGANPAMLSNNRKNVVLTTNSNVNYVNQIQQIVKNYEYKESVEDLSQYREAMFSQLFYLPIGCGEVLTEEIGATSFYGSSIKYFEEPIFNEDDSWVYYDSYFTINKDSTTISMSIYEEFFENDIFISDSYSYVTLNYVDQTNFNASLVTYTADMKYLSFTYLDSQKNFIDLQYDLVNKVDGSGNVIESYNVLISDGVNSYALTDKDITIACKNILVNMDNPTEHNEEIVVAKSNFTNSINVEKINLKMQEFMKDMADFEVPAPVFIVENGVLTSLDYRNTTEKDVLTIPGNVTALLWERMSVSPNVSKIIIPNSVEKLLIEKSTYDAWVKVQDTPVPQELPLIKDRYYELPLEYIEQTQFSLIDVRDPKNNNYVEKFDIEKLVIGDESPLFSKEENGNIYLNIRRVNDIAQDNEVTKYLIAIKDYEPFFGEDYAINIVNRSWEAVGKGQTPASEMFTNTERNLAEDLYSNALFYANTINVIIEDPYTSMLDNICVAGMMEYYNLEESYNIESYEPCLFEIKNLNIIDNLLPEYREELDNTWFNINIKYFKEIENLTISSKYAKMYSLSSSLKNDNLSLRKHKIDNIVVNEGLTGLQFETFELETNGIDFPTTMQKIDFSRCKLNYNADLSLSNLTELSFPDGSQWGFEDIALYINGDLTIDAINFDRYLWLNDIVATGDIVVNIGKNVLDLRYNNIQANSVTLKLDFTQPEFEKFIEDYGNQDYHLANTLKNILQEDNSIFVIQTKFGAELKNDVEGLIYDDKTQTYNYNVRNSQASLDLATFVKTENVTIKANTTNDYASAFSTNVNLNVGENIYYILVKNSNGEEVVSFKINIYRNKMFKFIIDTQGGTFDTEVQAQIDIEENVKNYFTFPEHQPIPQKDGYYFNTWYTNSELPEEFTETYYYMSMLPIFEYDYEVYKQYIQPTEDIIIYAHYLPSGE